MNTRDILYVLDMSQPLPKLVSLINVTHTYKSGITALQGVTCDIAKGSCTLVTGHNGAGKSSLLKVIRGEIDPTDGEVLIHDFSLSDFTSDDRTLLRQSTGYMDQDPQFLANLTVLENLKFFAEVSSHPMPNLKELLSKVGLEHTIDMYPSELSRGQKQILQTLRAVLHRPFLLIADEPIAHLDEKHVKTVVQLFQELQNAGTTLIVSTHRIDPFAHFPHKNHLQLNNGRLM